MAIAVVMELLLSIISHTHTCTHMIISYTCNMAEEKKVHRSLNNFAHVAYCTQIWPMSEMDNAEDYIIIYLKLNN